MKKIVFAATCMAFALLAAQASFAGMTSTFKLKDGSIIKGEIIAHSNRVYSVKSKMLGVLRIHEAKISSISTTASQSGSGSGHYGGNVSTGSASGSAKVVGGSRAMEQRLMSDPEIMNAIMSLSGDPQVQEILMDPAIMQAVAIGDMNALMANPKFMSLMNHPKIKAIQNKALK